MMVQALEETLKKPDFADELKLSMSVGMQKDTASQKRRAAKARCETYVQSCSVPLFTWDQSHRILAAKVPQSMLPKWC